MITTLFRVTKYGLQNFKRNAWLSTATIAIMALASMVFLSLIIFNLVTSKIVGSIQDKIDVSVYFKQDSAEDEILRVKATLETLPEVKTIEYISKDKALELFKERHKSEASINEAIGQLGQNPLSASLNIKARNPEEYSVIAKYFENDSIKPLVEKVSYSQNASVIERLNKVLRTAENGGLGLTLFMALIAVLITFNTIRLAIYTNRDSVTIMRLVGSSNFFIRGPFLTEGVLYGVVSSLVSTAIIAPIIYFVAPYGDVLVPELGLWGYFVRNIIILFGYQLIFGVGLGLVSSFIAIGKYLRDE